jgi:hypothetical protein
MSKIKEDTHPPGSPQSWKATYGTCLAGQAAVDGADHAAIEMENKWGAGRLRLLVPVELREKFDKQGFLFNAAVWHGDLAEVQEQSRRMINAWMALDKAAEARGASRLPAGVWEVALPDGTVAALVMADGSMVKPRGADPEGRRVVYYTLDEIAVMLGNYREVVTVKEAFPGSTVEAIRRTINDPLDGFRDGRRLEDTLEDDMPCFGH